MPTAQRFETRGRELAEHAQRIRELLLAGDAAVKQG